MEILMIFRLVIHQLHMIFEGFMLGDLYLLSHMLLYLLIFRNYEHQLMHNSSEVYFMKEKKRHSTINLIFITLKRDLHEYEYLNQSNLNLFLAESG